MGDERTEPVKSGAAPRAAARPAEESQASLRPLSPVQVSEVIREVVRQLAPEELPVFDSVAEDWVSGGQRRWRSGKPPGAAVGFGLDTPLLAYLAFPVITAALGEILGHEAEEGIRGRARRRAGRRAAAGGQAGGPGAVKSGERPAPGVLTSEQAGILHEACERHARVLGMPAARARVLADAVVGALSSARGGE